MCWSWNIFQLTGLGICAGFFFFSFLFLRQRWPFIKPHHSAVLDVFLIPSCRCLEKRGNQACAWGQGNTAALGGEWNQCHRADPVRCKRGWVVSWHGTSWDLGPQQWWGGTGGEKSLALPMFQCHSPLPSERTWPSARVSLWVESLWTDGLCWWAF